MVNKTVVVCNSANPDFKSYFRTLQRHLDKQQVLFLGNLRIIQPGFDTYIGSFTKTSFFDSAAILDFLWSPFILFYLRLKGVQKAHFISAHLSNVPQAIFAKLFGIKIITTIHDLVPHPDFKSKFIKLYNYFMIWLSYKVVVHNLQYKRRIMNKAVYVPLGGIESQEIELLPSRTLLFFGRIEPYKGVENLYELGKVLKRNKSDWKIVIAGKGNLPTGTLPENIQVINRFIDENELKDLMSMAAFTILPYNSASQSGVIILSYSYKVPVIVYKVGMLPEYVIDGKTGYIVEKNDFGKIIEILNSYSLKRRELLSKNIEDVYKELYSEEAFAKNTISVYES